jgi:diguanylate cyclase (GGDEF)-like protein
MPSESDRRAPHTSAAVTLFVQIALTCLIPAVGCFALLNRGIESIISNQAVADQMGSAQAMVDIQGSAFLTAEFFEKPRSASEATFIDQFIGPMFKVGDGSVKVTMYNANQLVVYSSAKELMGTVTRKQPVADALNGRENYGYVSAADSMGAVTKGRAARFTVPVLADGTTLGAIEVTYSNRIALLKMQGELRRLRLILGGGIAGLWLLAAASGWFFARRMQVRAQREEHLADHDPLTGLLNRRGLTRRTETDVTSTPLAVAVIDLDRFKPINDTYGHEAGDHTLAVVTERLQNAVRTGDAVARLGGDEFAVITAMPPSASMDDLIERIRQAISAPFSFDGQALVISASIGVATRPHDGDDIEDLLRIADQRMYEDKVLRRSHAFADQHAGAERSIR